MSKTESSTMKTTVVYNDSKTNRYLLRKEWDENLERLHYGKVSIVNLFSALNGKRTEKELDDENLAYITEAAERAEGIIYAVGKDGDGNKTVLKQQYDILNLLNPWKTKMQCIADRNGKKFYHPLCPAVHHWRLKRFDYGELKAFKSELPAENPIDFKEIGEAQEVIKSQELQESEAPPKKNKRNKMQNPNKQNS